jgi:predicted house-cleaning noncanonical NTP pyrophosphatase (MazG superfamily)
MSEKLIRDGILAYVLKERGELLKTRQASAEEQIQLLKAKLVEEANEVLNSTSHQNLIEEIADVLEVLKSLTEKINAVDEVFEVRASKALEKGGFDNGVVLIKD